MTPTGPKRGLVARLARTTRDLDDAALASSAKRAGAQAIVDADPRTLVTLQGRLAMVTLNPKGPNRWLEAELNDGTGAVRLIWIGRRVIPGIEPGRTLRVRGRIGVVGRVPTMYNPEYELLA